MPHAHHDTCTVLIQVLGLSDKVHAVSLGEHCRRAIRAHQDKDEPTYLFHTKKIFEMLDKPLRERNEKGIIDVVDLGRTTSERAVAHVRSALVGAVVP